MKCLTQAVGDGTWGELHDAYLLSSGGTNELNAIFKTFEPQDGKPVIGEKGTRLNPISHRPLPAGLIEELKHLPRAATVKEKSNQ